MEFLEFQEERKEIDNSFIIKKTITVQEAVKSNHCEITVKRSLK